MCRTAARVYVPPGQVFVRTAQVRVAPSHQEPQVTAQLLAQLLDAEVLEPDAAERLRALLRRESRDLPTMVRQGVHAPLRWFREVFPDIDADQAARVGYAAGAQARLTSYSPLSLPLVSAPAIHDALRLLAFLPLINNIVSARFLYRADDVAIVLSATSSDPVLDRFPIFYGAAAFVRLLTLLATEPFELKVHLAWPRPEGFEQRPEVVGGRLCFNAPLHYILISRAALQTPCRFADPVAYQSELAGLQERMARLGMSDHIEERVRRLVEQEGSLLSIEQAAAALHLTVSTLKRRLAVSGTGFRALRDAVLRDRALLLLTDPGLSMEAIASALGYSDTANFSHAFKRWTGRPPGAFRKPAAVDLVA